MKFLSIISLVALASAAPAELFKRDSATCGKVTYNDAAIQAAASSSCEHVQNGDTAGSSTYPHQYKNFEGFKFKGIAGPYFEFPIMSSGKEYTGGSPGADRVIIAKEKCEVVGVITHQGAKGNNFVACSGTS
ncbi:Guanyl-specific ribonuclease Th1 [Cladobotryum mycophilum]|uniref:ribonuclease T1 n=1 Tax=Cladobotryum mycophilum TaxID=491253 RepID=A0ABR0SAS4_9HYPO